MKLEINGRVVLGFLLGGICGVIATAVFAAGPIGRIQRDRDDARASVVTLKSAVADLQWRLAVQQAQTQAQSFGSVTAQPSGFADSRMEAVVVAMYNKLHPGLGDAIKTLIQQKTAHP